MENNSFQFLSFQEDGDLPMSYQDFTIWDVGLNQQISYPQKVEVGGGDQNGKQTKEPQEEEEIINHGGTSNHAVQKKKIMHRDIERQRRQEMATLYSSLRSVLPPQFLKGKRSITDQIHEATKYIRYLQKNVKDLGTKRDNMKKLSKSSELQLESDQNGRCSKILKFSVTVQSCSIGVEVLVSGDHFMVEGTTLPVSRILQLLHGEGLVAVCCNWTKCDGGLQYVIQSEVFDCPEVNLQMLQRKLNGMINSWIDVN